MAIRIPTPEQLQRSAAKRVAKVLAEDAIAKNPGRKSATKAVAKTAAKKKAAPARSAKRA